MSLSEPYQVQPHWAGLVNYAAAWEWQQQLTAERHASPEIEGKLLLLEHTPTYTIGRGGDIGNLLLDEAALAERGIALHRVDRGGDITYHGPGQLVGYPILNLHRVYQGYGLARVKRYVTDLEEALIRTLARFDISGERFQGHRGVWVKKAAGMAKVAAIGVRVGAESISSHGFALNVNPDMRFFDGIVPCGISQHGVTSMRLLLGRDVAVSELLPHIAADFASVFRWPEQPITPILPPTQEPAAI